MDNASGLGLASRFSQVEHEILTQNQRYVEVKSRLVEPKLGQCRSRLVQTPGMTIFHVTMELTERLEVQEAETGQEVSSAFVREGRVISRFEQVDGPIIVGKEQHAFQYNPYSTSSHTIEAGHFEALQVQYDLDFLKSLLQSAEDRHTDRLGSHLEKKEVFLVRPDRFPLRAELLSVFQSLQEDHFRGPTRLLLLESKLLELLSRQFEQVVRPDSSAGSGLSATDRQKLYAVRDYLERHYLLPLSLGQLCQMFGLNEFKLKKGYKRLFQTTVFGHILQLRLTKARQLLTEGQLTVSEIADLVGYSNVQAFSAAFRRMYGYPPSKLIARPIFAC